MDFKNIVVYLLGLISSNAYDDLSFQKVASQSSSWYDGLYKASYAVDRNTSTWARMLEIGRSSHSKTAWWRVDLGGVYSIYSINILFKNYDGNENRQRGRFAGFSLYVSNTYVSTISDIKGSTLCYKDGPQLPPLNFTTTCAECGRYVIFYNERLDRVTYPTNYEVVNVYSELLEVIVQGAYTYGRNCDAPCPSNCKDNICHIDHGTCYGCKPGWTGLYCTISMICFIKKIYI
nr:uncharacterized protein LOC117687713 isoform X2 [Crassostrea gigas]